MKLCVDCLNYYTELNVDGRNRLHRCMRPYLSRVTGLIVRLNEHAEQERGNTDPNACGPEAQFHVAK